MDSVIQEFNRALTDEGFLLAPPEGEEEFQREVGRYLHHRLGHPDRPYVLPAHSSQEALRNILRALTEIGDGVLVVEPYLRSYGHVIEEMGRRLQVVQDKQWMEDPMMALDRTVDSSTRMILVSDPWLPVGIGLDSGQKEMLVRFCDVYDLILVCDESWADMCGERALDSITSYTEGKVTALTIHDFCPALGMNGMKLAAVAAHDEALMDRVFHGYSLNHQNCTSLVSQKAVAHALLRGGVWSEQMNEFLQERKYQMMEVLRDLPFAWQMPDSGHLVVLRLSDGRDASIWSDSLYFSTGLRLPSVSENWCVSGSKSLVCLNYGVSPELLDEVLDRLKWFTYRQSLSENRAA